MDRTDLQFAAKELRRKMADPETRDRKVHEILAARSPGFPFDTNSEKVDGFAQSDWTGAPQSRG